MTKPEDNAPCHCGSGKAYSQCCQQRDILQSILQPDAAPPIAPLTPPAPLAPSAEQLIEVALTHHQAGRLAEAESLYRQILQANPNHPDALHLLGILAQQVGQPEEALKLIGQAIQCLPGNPIFIGNLGNIYKAQGQLDKAVESYRQVAALTPDDADAHSRVGDALLALGQPGEASLSYQQALALKPDAAETHNNLGLALQQQGQVDAALGHYREALNYRPDFVAALINLGNALSAQGRNDEAIGHYRQALQLQPEFPEAHNNLGSLYQEQGKLNEAIGCYRRAIELNPAYADAHYNLGDALHEQAQFDEAIACYRQALALNPNYAEACNNLGNALQEQGQVEEAIDLYRKALTLKPDYVEAHCNLGKALHTLKRLDEASACYHQALAIRPDYAEAHCNLGSTLQAQLRPLDAIASYRRALALKPDYAEAFSNMGGALQAVDKLDEAIASYRQAILIKPDFADAQSNLIYALDLKAGVDTATLQAERRRWGEAFANGRYVVPPFANPPDPERRLRIGYVSADFRNHSAAVAFGAMLTRFDPAMFDVFVYANSIAEDDHARIFRQSVSGWRKIVGLTDAAVAGQIRRDAIDILVDLSGHTAGNRLLVFARKPAPIQISAWGYAGGTGMKAMDVLLSDVVIVPPEEKSLYAEEVRYLPSVISAFFPAPFPPINAMPGKEGAITFGSFNRLSKVSAETYGAWAQILLANPGSRMIIKAGELDYTGTRERVLGYFAEAGIAPDRLSLLGGSSWQDHVATFNRIDISLDPFPQCGGVTTLESLMMGVPVVTLRGSTFVGRGSASILTTLGLTDWIAESAEQYVDIATRKAGDLTALAELRQQLRPRFMSSILGDTAAYARVAEQEYRKLWREWCAKHHDL